MNRTFAQLVNNRSQLIFIAIAYLKFSLHYSATVQQKATYCFRVFNEDLGLAQLELVAVHVDTVHEVGHTLPRVPAP